MSPERPKRLQDIPSLPDCSFRRSPGTPGRVILSIVETQQHRVILDGDATVLSAEFRHGGADTQVTEEFPVITQEMLDATSSSSE